VVAAASTLAAAGACTRPPSPPEYSRNPPGIESGPGSAEGSDSVVLEKDSPGAATETAPETGGPEPPEAKLGQRVRRGADGTCWIDIDPDCPPPESGMTCNPPPPMEVRCPGEG